MGVFITVRSISPLTHVSDVSPEGTPKPLISALKCSCRGASALGFGLASVFGSAGKAAPADAHTRTTMAINLFIWSPRPRILPWAMLRSHEEREDLVRKENAPPREVRAAALAGQEARVLAVLEPPLVLGGQRRPDGD